MLFMTSASSTAASITGFKLESVALRTQHDPAQVTWKSGKKSALTEMEVGTARKALRDYLSARGEPVGHSHLHTAALIALAEVNALKKAEDEFDFAMRKTQSLMEQALKDSHEFIHYSTGEGIDTGMGCGFDTPGKHGLLNHLLGRVIIGQSRSCHCDVSAKESASYFSGSRRRIKINNSPD